MISAATFKSLCRHRILTSAAISCFSDGRRGKTGWPPTESHFIWSFVKAPSNASAQRRILKYLTEHQKDICILGRGGFGARVSHRRECAALHSDAWSGGNRRNGDHRIPIRVPQLRRIYGQFFEFSHLALSVDIVIAIDI